MTIKECQEEHKKLWNWIADETERRRGIVYKDDYFKQQWSTLRRVPHLHCFACEHDKIANDNEWNCCNSCPIDWGKIFNDELDTKYMCQYHQSPYQKWREMRRKIGLSAVRSPMLIKELADLAREVATLPFKEEEDEI